MEACNKRTFSPDASIRRAALKDIMTHASHLRTVMRRDVIGKNITVNNIPPGMIDTPMLRRAEAHGNVASLEKIAARVIPIGRAGTPEEIAATCGFLCSDEAAFITGQVIGVNGGMVL